MAPKGTADKQWRAALDSLVAALMRDMMFPNAGEDTPEDEKYMDPGTYLMSKYPSPESLQQYYADLIAWLTDLGADFTWCTQVVHKLLKAPFTPGQSIFRVNGVWERGICNCS